MPLQVSRLRRWFAIGAVAIVIVVAGTYFYARWRLRSALQNIPGKIGIEVQQTANDFTISRSEQGRTIFKIQASKAVQYKQGGHATLHDVTITLYGRDSTRFDQISGSDFEYDPQSGDVTAKGQVQIDLEANPQGLAAPDQTVPRELKNPVHLVTSGLVFNQKSGNAETKEKVEFSIPQASGSAVGVSYVSKTNLLTLHSQVRVVFSGSTPATVTATDGAITKEPREVVLNHPRIESPTEVSQADKATMFLRQDNMVERVLAEGSVQMDSRGPQPSHVSAAKLEVLMVEGKDVLRTAIFSGKVQMSSEGKQSMRGSAERVVMDFEGKNLLTRVHSQGNVQLTQRQAASPGSAGAQDLVLSASAMDFYVKNGKRLTRGETSGAAQIEIRSASSAEGQQTLVSAGKFSARFDDAGKLAAVHGEPDARIVTRTPGQSDRVSTSLTLDATFRSGGGIDSIVQQGNMAYVDGDRKAWADKARYTPQDQMLSLSGSPRVTDGGMTTTARTMRLNRATGEAVAEGDVKSSYSDLKAQPDGALLASSSPIHVTSKSMTAQRSPAIATYTGEARLWQDANIVRAPTIQFDRDKRSVIARGTAAQTVSTILVQSDSRGKATPVTVTGSKLTYTDADRKAHLDGDVVAKGNDVTITAKQMDALLEARGPDTSNQPASSQIGGTGKLDRIIAQGGVVITQPSRRAEGDQLVYTAADDKFVLSGGTPSIFDAEHGKITGVSLTFFRHDDRVVVEGNDSSPAVTHTRVAR
ncbi:MAG TPA: LPS export ABC transporter periplasmic protein LptC [Terriglobales bacterium]|jgi:lipopolysaccharide export system protein LptA